MSKHIQLYLFTLSLILITACSDSDDFVDGELLYGNIKYSCGPTDAGILLAYMADNEEACDVQFIRLADGYRAQLEWMNMNDFTSHIKLLPHEYNDQSGVNNRNLTYCNIDGCKSVGEAELEIMSVNETHIVGKYQFELSNEKRKGSFELLKCPSSTEICG